MPIKTRPIAAIRGPGPTRKPRGPGDGPIVITMPYPPSYNRYWRTGPHGKGYISGEGRAFKARALAALIPMKLQPFGGPVKVTLKYYRPRKSGDLDNNIKCLLDCLQGAAYVNDSQIVEISAKRFDDKANPRVEVTVEEIP